MPTYEYVCKSCGARLEIVQSFSDEALRECTSCGGELKKVFGSVGIVFKGSGFYKTDSRSSTTSSSVSTSTPSAPASETPSSTPSESASSSSDSSAPTAANATSA
jgi:putative FmdB family regulatory protein